jgi:hypothetical protein
MTTVRDEEDGDNGHPWNAGIPFGGCMPTEGLISGFAFRVEWRSRTEGSSHFPTVNTTKSSAGRPPLGRTGRISIGWKAQSLRIPRPKAQKASNNSWTDDHKKPLVLVWLLMQSLDVSSQSDGANNWTRERGSSSDPPRSVDPVIVP